MNKDNISFKKVLNPNGEYELPRPIAPIGSLDTTDAMNKLTLLIKDRFSKLPREMGYEEWKDYCELFVLSAKASFIDKTEIPIIRITSFFNFIISLPFSDKKLYHLHLKLLQVHLLVSY